MNVNPQITDEWIAEQIEKRARRLINWSRRFKWASVNDDEDYYQIAWLVCLEYADSIKACETLEHAEAYINLAIKGRIINGEGFYEGRPRCVLARPFSQGARKGDADVPTLDRFVQASEKEAWEKVEDRAEVERFWAYVEDYLKDKCDSTNVAVRGVIKGEPESGIAKRLGCSIAYVNNAKRRFIEYAKGRERELL